MSNEPVDSDSETSSQSSDADSPVPEIAAVHRLHLWEFQAVRDLLLLLAGFGLLWLGWRLSSITVPMLVALGLSYICEPLIQKLQGFNERWTRMRSVITVMVGVVLSLLLTLGAVLVLVVPQAHRLADFATKQYDRLGSMDLPAMGLEWLASDSEPAKESAEEPREVPPAVSTPLVVDEASASTATVGDDALEAPVEEVPEQQLSRDEVEAMIAEAVAAQVADALAAEAPPTEQQSGVHLPPLQGMVPSITRGGQFVLGFVGSIIAIVVELGFAIFLVGFFFFIFSLSWPAVLKFGDELLPGRHKERLHFLIDKMDLAVAGFVRGRLLICGLLGLIFGVGWTLVGVPHAIALGVVIALLTLIPYASSLGLPLAWMLLYGSLSQDLSADGFYVAEGGIIWWKFIVFPAVIYFIAQFLDDWVLSPKIQGDATGLDTASIIVAVMAGGNLMGMYGMLLAIPVAACIRILLTEELWPRLQAWLAGESSDPLPLPGGGMRNGS